MYFLRVRSRPERSGLLQPRQPLSNVSIRHTAAPLTELFLTSSDGVFSLSDVCEGDSYVAKRTGYVDIEFQAIATLQSLTMQIVGE